MQARAVLGRLLTGSFPLSCTNLKYAGVAWGMSKAGVQVPSGEGGPMVPESQVPAGIISWNFGDS